MRLHTTREAAIEWLTRPDQELADTLLPLLRNPPERTWIPESVKMNVSRELNLDPTQAHELALAIRACPHPPGELLERLAGRYQGTEYRSSYSLNAKMGDEEWSLLRNLAKDRQGVNLGDFVTLALRDPERVEHVPDFPRTPYRPVKLSGKTATEVSAFAAERGWKTTTAVRALLFAGAEKIEWVQLKFLEGINRLTSDVVRLHAACVLTHLVREEKPRLLLAYRDRPPLEAFPSPVGARSTLALHLTWAEAMALESYRAQHGLTRAQTIAALTDLAIDHLIPGPEPLHVRREMIAKTIDRYRAPSGRAVPWGAGPFRGKRTEGLPPFAVNDP